MKYSDEFIEETLRENVNLRLQYFEYKEKAKKSEERYYKYKHQISREAQNKNKEQIVRERDILHQRIDKAIEYIKENDLYTYVPDNDLGMDYNEMVNEKLLDILKGDDKNEKENNN